MKRLSYFFLALFFFCFGIVTPGCSKNASGEAPEVSAGTWINTDSFKLADHKDKIVIVEFWATWCPPCRTSIPHLKTLYNEYKDKGVMMVSLSQEPADTINEFNKKAGMNWIIGAESTSGADYGVSGIPAAYIVVDGKIAWNGHPMGGLDAELKKIVEARGGAAVAPAAPAAEPVAAPAPADIIPAGDVEAPSAEPAAVEPVSGDVNEDPLLGDDVILPDDEEVEIPASEAVEVSDNLGE